jgi:two-component system NtrC family sensor kinase
MRPNTGWQLSPGKFLNFPDDRTSPERYRILRRKIITLMILVTVAPCSFLSFIIYRYYNSNLANAANRPLLVLTDKGKHALDLIFKENLTAINFIASLHSYEELTDADELNRIFHILKQEVGGIADIGIFDVSGRQVNYIGPHDLSDKHYADQEWFRKTVDRGAYISDVITGLQEKPHISISIIHRATTGRHTIIRITIDTSRIEAILEPLAAELQGDAVLVNRKGMLQTNARFYGSVLERSPCTVDPSSAGIDVLEKTDPQGRVILLSCTKLDRSDFTMVLIRPKGGIANTWTRVNAYFFFFFFGGLSLTVMIIIKLTRILVERIREADEKREYAFRELEHSQKLSSIGRLAAGVAHEINNPLMIINEDAGLMQDLLDDGEGPKSFREFSDLAQSISQSVDRCREVTHRLLGFAHRLEPKLETLNLNSVLEEVVGFLETEARHRKIDIRKQYDDGLPTFFSDQGQLQQVFLNILTNAFAAVSEGGHITIKTFEEGRDSVAAIIQDNGVGMSEDTLKHIFEPFFTTKKEYGTGLGLPITYGIVRKLGGDIKVQSREGKGTMFTIYLPNNSRDHAAARK